MNNSIFKKGKINAKTLAGGPSYEEQISAIVNNRYWFVLNTHHLSPCSDDSSLCDRTNAFKHALQTYGPNAINLLPNTFNNKGKAGNHIYHGHITNSTGTIYVLEWTIVDREKRIMAIVGFGSHENYPFKQEPLTKTERTTILSDPNNIKIIENAERAIKETKLKVDRTELNYRHCS